MSTDSSQGVLYIATGAKYIRAAIRSAETVRAHCPGLAIHLFADWQRHGFDFGASPHPFSSVEQITDPNRRSKVDYMARSPFDHTLFLDTDTAVVRDIRGLFGLLDRFDIAASHAPRRPASGNRHVWHVSMPHAFPQFNSGVLLFRKSPAVVTLLDQWRHHYHSAGFPQDQVTLRELLWLSDLRIATLPPEYNVRFMKYHYMWSKREASTHIFHRRRYHDGPFFRVHKWVRRVGRVLARRGLGPRRWLDDGPR